MLRNTFRKAVGMLILMVFGLAIFRFAAQTQGNPYVGSALAFGFKVILVLALALALAYLFDRRIRNREP